MPRVNVSLDDSRYQELKRVADIAYGGNMSLALRALGMTAVRAFVREIEKSDEAVQELGSASLPPLAALMCGKYHRTSVSPRDSEGSE